MPGQVIGTELPLGYPGTVARTPDNIIANRLLNQDSEPVKFGAPVILNEDNTYSAFGTSVAEVFGGIAVREVKQAISYYDQNNVSYLPGQQCDVLERGNIVVRCTKGTPKAGSKVYIRTEANDIYPGAKVGDFEAEADADKTVELSGVAWSTGRVDSNGSCELIIKNRV